MGDTEILFVCVMLKQPSVTTQVCIANQTLARDQATDRFQHISRLSGNRLALWLQHGGQAEEQCPYPDLVVLIKYENRNLKIPFSLFTVLTHPICTMSSS